MLGKRVRRKKNKCVSSSSDDSENRELRRKPDEKDILEVKKMELARNTADHDNNPKDTIGDNVKSVTAPSNVKQTTAPRDVKEKEKTVGKKREGKKNLWLEVCFFEPSFTVI